MHKLFAPILLVALASGCAHAPTTSAVAPAVSSLSALHQFKPKNAVEAALNTQLLAQFKGQKPEVHSVTVGHGTFVAEVHATPAGGVEMLDTVEGKFDVKTNQITESKVTSSKPE